MLQGEAADLGEGLFDGPGVVGNLVLNGEQATGVLEAGEEVERGARDVGGEEKRRCGVAGSGRGGYRERARIHGDLGWQVSRCRQPQDLPSGARRPRSIAPDSRVQADVGLERSRLVRPPALP